MAFQGTIFDLNGVLWWDGPLQEASWRQFSTQVRGRPLTAEELALHVHGRNNRHTLEYLTGHELEEPELAHLAAEKEAIYRRLCLEQGTAFQLSPGATDLLEFLAAHQIPRAIATASGWENVCFFVDHLHLDRWFDPESIVHDDGARPGKPAPDVYLAAAGVLGLAPGHCVVVEDSISGLAAAHAAGIGYVVALGPAGQHAMLARLAGVDQVIESLGDLPREWLFL